MLFASEKINYHLHFHKENNTHNMSGTGRILNIKIAPHLKKD